jgi:glutaredoxin-related protein
MSISEKSSENNIMIPQEGDITINVPTPFVVSEGRRGSSNFKKASSIIIGIASVVFSIYVTFFGEGFFIANLLFGLFTLLGASIFIRFFMYKEGFVRNTELELLDNDYRRKSSDFWNIFSISSEYPYFCFFKNGAKGVFVAFEKDVTVGEVTELEYSHYDAISDAYNTAYSENIDICHMDYMDDLGSDLRMDECISNLDVEGINTDLKDVLLDVFNNLKEQMAEETTTYDVYLYYSVGMSENSFTYSLEKILSHMMLANYSSYNVLEEKEIRSLVKPLLNINNFSVLDAIMDSFDTSEDSSYLTLISVESKNGEETKVSKTRQERLDEVSKKSAENKAKKKDKTKKKGKKKGKDSQETDWDDLL